MSTAGLSSHNAFQLFITAAEKATKHTNNGIEPLETVEVEGFKDHGHDAIDLNKKDNLEEGNGVLHNINNKNIFQSLSNKTRNLSHTYSPSIFRIMFTTYSALGLIFFFCYTQVSLKVPNLQQYRSSGALAEGLIILILSVIDIMIQKREHFLSVVEMRRHIKSLIDGIKKNGITFRQELKLPTSVPTISIAKILRDGIVSVIPYTLIVQNDIVFMSLGEPAPCDIQIIFNIPKKDTLDNKEIKNDGNIVYNQDEITNNIKKEIPNFDSTVFSLKQGELFRTEFFYRLPVIPKSPTSSVVNATISDISSEVSSISDIDNSANNDYNINGSIDSGELPDLEELADNDIPKKLVHESKKRNPELGKINIEQYAFQDEGRFYFISKENVIENVISKALAVNRPETVMSKQLKLLNGFIRLATISTFSISLVANIICYAINASESNDRRKDGYEYIVVLPIYAMLPILPIFLPSIIVLMKQYGSARILSLFDLLQNSIQEFQDDEDIDEFDAAPPPTKDISLKKMVVLKRFISQLFPADPTFISRSAGLVDAISEISVLCAIDREGTMTYFSPTMEQFYFLDDSGETNILDVTDSHIDHAMRFEDRDWDDYIENVKPLGLNLMLTTDCVDIYGKRRFDHHRKANGMVLHGHIPHYRQSCICQLSQQIGFTYDVIGKYTTIKNVQTFRRPGKIISKVPDYHFEIPSIFSKLVEDKSTSQNFVFTEGNTELVLENCLDYWSGSSVIPFLPLTIRKLLSANQQCIIGDSFTVTYAFRPITDIESESIPEDVPGYTQYILDSKDIPKPPERKGAGFFEKHDNIRIDTSLLSVKTGHDSNVVYNTIPLSPVDSVKINRVVNFKYGNRIENERLPLTTSQTFLGMGVFAFQPKANVVDFIEDLGLAGIRFVCFSDAPERESKAYGERLGLEINWNSCILLSNNKTKTLGYTAEHDLNARLPVGVENIRQHIETTDDVPLHVPLFAESKPDSINEMIRIFQEHDEVVCCIGSSLNVNNVNNFSTADISIGVDPLSFLKSRHIKNVQAITPLLLSSAFITAPCALNLHMDTSVYAISQMIREARAIANQQRQALLFYVGCCFSLSIIIIITQCMALPSVFSGYQIIWCTVVISSILTLSFFSLRYDQEIMTFHPGKNGKQSLRDSTKVLAVYFILRFSVAIIVTILTFVFSLNELNKTYLSINGSRSIFERFGSISWLELSRDEQSALLISQNCALFVWTFHMVVMSSTFLSRIEPLFQFNQQKFDNNRDRIKYWIMSILPPKPFGNGLWAFVAVLCIGIQVAFFAVSCHDSVFKLNQIPFWVYIIGLVTSPLLSLPLQEIAKNHDRNEWKKYQRRRKLEFNTKLGMHSPL